MLMTRLNLLYELFERIVAQDRFGHCFANQGQDTKVSLPLEYQVFVTAKARYLPSNWVLYSFFGYETVPIDQVRAEMITEGLPEELLSRAVD